VLRLAASLDQLSAHSLAEALVHDAQVRGLALASPGDVEEGRGMGIAGVVDGQRVAVGSSAWLRRCGFADAEEAARALDGGLDAGRARILVGVDGRLVGAVVMADKLRDDATSPVAKLRAVGIRRVVLTTGDRLAVARAVGSALGVDSIHAEQSPEDKLELVRSLRADPELRTVVMVGDGVNDASALALADVGIALGAAGATVASETADAVIVVDRVDRVLDALRIGARSLAIARQSILVGMALSVGAMGAAAAGLLQPVPGALLQEAIDVAVIVNALRALRD
jgi:cation transport ATPase